MRIFEMPWGNKIYRKACPEGIHHQLSSCATYLPPLLNTQVRGKEMWLQIDGLFMVWLAVFIDEIEPEQLDWIDAMPSGSVLYDIGAGVGAYTTYAALSGMRCYAFEPDSQNHAALEMHHCLNRKRMLHPIFSFNIALSDKKGCDYLYSENYEKGTHRKVLGKPEFTPIHKQNVMTYSLEGAYAELGLPAPNYLKIDADRSELPILRGAGALLAAPSLKGVFIEITGDSMGKECEMLIEQHGFTKKLKKPVEAYEGLYNVIYERV